MPWPKGKPFPPEMVAKRIATYSANGKKARMADYRTDEQRDAVSKVWVVDFRRGGVEP